MAGPVDVVLLRGLLPELPLTPGTVVHGRVLDARTLVLAGVRMAARLPEGVEPGQVLRLQVAEASAERLHLRVVPGPAQADQPEAAQAAAHADPAAAGVPPGAYELALPGGVVVWVAVSEREEAGGRRARGQASAVVVRYDSPSLGRLDVRLDRGSAAVHVSAGAPAEAVRGAAGVLRDALGRATGAPVLVTVHPREETLDVRA